MSFTRKLRKKENYPNNVVSTAGSLLYVGKLQQDRFEPEEVTITLDSTPNVGDTQLNVTANKDIVLRKNFILWFRKFLRVTLIDKVELSAGVSTTIDIDELPDPIPEAGDTAPAWEVFKLLSPTALPSELTSDSVDRKDYSMGLQGQKVKTRVSLTSEIELINRKDDEAFYKILHPANLSAENIFVFIITKAHHIFGSAQVNNKEDTNKLDDISRISTQVRFQRPFNKLKSSNFFNKREKSLVDKIRRRLGIELISNELFFTTFSADFNKVDNCFTNNPSTYIAEETSSVRLTYSANYNSVTYCNTSTPSTYIAEETSSLRLTYSANYNSVTWCNSNNPSTYILETTSLFLLTYSAEYNSVTWCNTSAPSTYITAT